MVAVVQNNQNNTFISQHIVWQVCDSGLGVVLCHLYPFFIHFLSNQKIQENQDLENSWFSNTHFQNLARIEIYIMNMHTFGKQNLKCKTPFKMHNIQQIREDPLLDIYLLP